VLLLLCVVVVAVVVASVGVCGGVAGIALFIKEMGLVHFAYRSDCEPAIKLMFEEACRVAGRTCTPVASDHPNASEPVIIENGDVAAVELGAEHDLELAQVRVAVPEHSHTGESASNGIAERAVQQWEDHFRTCKAALEADLNIAIDIHHPIFTWLVQHAGYLPSKYLIGHDGKTGFGEAARTRTKRNHM